MKIQYMSCSWEIMMSIISVLASIVAAKIG